MIESGTRPDEEARRQKFRREIRARDIAAFGGLVVSGLLVCAAWAFLRGWEILATLERIGK